jgi:hypothetical protein
MQNKILFFVNRYPLLPIYAYISRASLFDFETLQQNFACQRLDLFLFPHSWAAGPLALATSALAAKFKTRTRTSMEPPCLNYAQLFLYLSILSQLVSELFSSCFNQINIRTLWLSWKRTGSWPRSTCERPLCAGP